MLKTLILKHLDAECKTSAEKEHSFIPWGVDLFNKSGGLCLRKLSHSSKRGGTAKYVLYGNQTKRNTVGAKKVITEPRDTADSPLWGCWVPTQRCLHLRCLVKKNKKKKAPVTGAPRCPFSHRFVFRSCLPTTYSNVTTTVSDSHTIFQ